MEFFALRDAGFDPSTSALVVWSAANELPHLLTPNLMLRLIVQFYLMSVGRKD